MTDQSLTTAQKKSRKQRIPGGRRTLATSGGDWIALSRKLSQIQDSIPTARTVGRTPNLVNTFLPSLHVPLFDINRFVKMIYVPSAELAGRQKQKIRQSFTSVTESGRRQQAVAGCPDSGGDCGLRQGIGHQSRDSSSLHANIGRYEAPSISEV